MIDVLFVCDILIAFRTTYFDSISGEEIYNARKTAVEYLKSRFLIDFVSTIPLDSISEYLFKVKNKKLQLFSTLKLVRIARMDRMITRLNVTSNTKHKLKLLKLGLYYLLYIHVLGCIWFAVI